jgi:hypothetical protein
MLDLLEVKVNDQRKEYTSQKIKGKQKHPVRMVGDQVAKGIETKTACKQYKRNDKASKQEGKVGINNLVDHGF